MENEMALEMMYNERSEDGYDELLKAIGERFNSAVKNGDEPVFRTDASGLFDLFLENLPEDARQYYNCNACRHFVRKYGGLVTIDERGMTHPVMWPVNAPKFFRKAVDEIILRVVKAKVVGAFATSAEVLGRPGTAPFVHMAVGTPKAMIFNKALKTASQREDELRQDYLLLLKATKKYPIGFVESAVNMLRFGMLYRSDAVLKNAEWFLDVQEQMQLDGISKRPNMLWKSAVTAPTGYCHISSNMLGTLLDDIINGLSGDEIKRKFDDKMNPLQYQRPQAPPTKGNVARAEEIVKKLGIKKSLNRRFARLDEIQTIWRPEEEAKPKDSGGSVFAGIKTKAQRNYERGVLTANAGSITFEKFRNKVLGYAKKIEYYCPPTSENYCAIVTAADMDAPPILMWDSEEHRNPFSWYMYFGKSTPGSWNLRWYEWVNVNAVTLKPSMWCDGFEFRGKGAIFILEGCKDSNYHRSGNALFPETLKSELREIRSTIEAYSKDAALGGYDEASACGIAINGDGKYSIRLRVTSDVGVTEYTIDR